MWWSHCKLLCTSVAVSKHFSGSGAKMPNRQDESAGFRTSDVTSSESHTKLKEKAIIQLVYGMERTHNIAALHKHKLMARVEEGDC